MYRAKYSSRSALQMDFTAALVIGFGRTLKNFFFTTSSLNDSKCFTVFVIKTDSREALQTPRAACTLSAKESRIVIRYFSTSVRFSEKSESARSPSRRSNTLFQTSLAAIKTQCSFTAPAAPHTHSKSRRNSLKSILKPCLFGGFS